jgi:hypothetical protein
MVGHAGGHCKLAKSDLGRHSFIGLVLGGFFFGFKKFYSHRMVIEFQQPLKQFLGFRKGHFFFRHFEFSIQLNFPAARYKPDRVYSLSF